MGEKKPTSLYHKHGYCLNHAYWDMNNQISPVPFISYRENKTRERFIHVVFVSKAHRLCSCLCTCPFSICRTLACPFRSCRTSKEPWSCCPARDQQRASMRPPSTSTSSGTPSLCRSLVSTTQHRASKSVVYFIYM